MYACAWSIYACDRALTLYLGVLALFEAHIKRRVCVYMWGERELMWFVSWACGAGEAVTMCAA